jgi:hypothetical protein
MSARSSRTYIHRHRANWRATTKKPHAPIDPLFFCFFRFCDQPPPPQFPTFTNEETASAFSAPPKRRDRWSSPCEHACCAHARKILRLPGGFWISSPTFFHAPPCPPPCLRARPPPFSLFLLRERLKRCSPAVCFSAVTSIYTYTRSMARSRSLGVGREGSTTLPGAAQRRQGGGGATTVPRPQAAPPPPLPLPAAAAPPPLLPLPPAAIPLSPYPVVLLTQLFCSRANYGP